MEIDQSLLESLPLQQRQRLGKQLRQEQIRRYNEWEAREGAKYGATTRMKKKNKKGTMVAFEQTDLLKDATERFDDREVLLLVEKGTSANLRNPSGLSLLHKCCIDDNLSVAEILVSHGADVNVQDEDLWTPLHYACECDHADLVQLLLSNGADATVLDVDGNFAIDHAPETSYSRMLLKNHLDKNGVDANKLKELRVQTPRRMLADVKALVEAGGDVNVANVDGTTLLHIASANGYREVAKVILSSGRANINARDRCAWTPLHTAAKYGQLKMVRLLLKYKADPHLETNDGVKATQVSMTQQIQELLKKAEKKSPQEVMLEKKASEEDEDEEDVAKISRRINSKVLRSRHTSLSKKDELFEAQTRFGSTAPPVSPQIERRVDMEEGDIYQSLSFAHPAVTEVTQEMTLPSISPTDNLASQPEITAQVLMGELQKRYREDRIYTLVGDILIAMNPYKYLPIYSKEIIQKYDSETNLASLPPHIYGVADKAYQALLRESQSQCCVISGESGAGKTESSKYLVQHLLTVAQSEESNLNSKIQRVNPLLEAFGNARTVMNDNSSRFGKYLELKFSDDGYVMGAKIYEYLLEKSRVVYQGKGESNFHIFYLMFAGLSPDEFRKYGLESANKHRYLQSAGVDIKSHLTQDNRDKFRELCDCLKYIGFTSDDIDVLLTSLSAVLHLGDIQFEAVGNNEAAQISNIDKLKKVSHLLQVPSSELGMALVAEINITRGEQIKKERNLTQASDCRDALAKALYGRLFSWIVNGINQLIQPLENSGPCIDVGVLDIFGFENFPKNSFEQICINLANEQLQHYFNEHIFNLELDDCAIEGIPPVDIDFTNNKPVLDVFLEKPLGIFAILDEESRFPRATDKSMATKLHNGPGQNYPNIYLIPKDGGTSFSIMHYAGKIQYNLVGVLDKNRDTLPNSILFTMKISNSLAVKEMFQARLTRTGSLAPSTRQQRSRKATDTKSAFDFFKRKKSQAEKKPRRSRIERPVIGTDRKGPSTVAYHFKNSLADLMAKINSSSPHFVRCIKPNMGKASTKYDADYVRAQLRYTGVMETVRIRQQGYAMRIKFSDFLERYDVIALCGVARALPMTDLAKCKKLLQYCQLRDYKVGKTKLFFRYWHVDQLAHLSRSLEAKVLVTQKVMRGWLERKRFARLVTVKNRQDRFVGKFLQDIEMRAATASQCLTSTREHDTERRKPKTREPKVVMRQKGDDMMARNEELRHSLEELDKVVQEAEDAITKDGDMLSPWS